MNAAKFSPRPTGSRIVNRTFPGGSPVKNRNITACIEFTAAARPRSAAFHSTAHLSGNGRNAGSFMRTGLSGINRSSLGSPSAMAY